MLIFSKGAARVLFPHRPAAVPHDCTPATWPRRGQVRFLLVIGLPLGSARQTGRQFERRDTSSFRPPVVSARPGGGLARPAKARYKFCWHSRAFRSNVTNLCHIAETRVRRPAAFPSSPEERSSHAKLDFPLLAHERHRLFPCLPVVPAADCAHGVHCRVDRRFHAQRDWPRNGPGHAPYAGRELLGGPIQSGHAGLLAGGRHRAGRHLGCWA